MIESEYKYRLRDKTATWGIAIDIVIAFEENNTETLVLNYDKSVFLTLEEKEMIHKALNFILKDNSGGSYNFLIKNVIFNDCDYQKEGLFYATILWAVEHFTFEKPSEEFTFDKKSNTYVFDFLG